ncbi:MAG: flagellar protein FlgN [Erythrobacter sp.]|nr:flagellar protein FlgN [Erythrobacter sp.]
MSAVPTDAPRDVTGNLRQMIAVLEQERQALASLDIDALTVSTRAKETLCDALMPIGSGELGAEARELARTAQQLNDVNRRVRNLLAANVSARLEALGGARTTYAPAAYASASL